MDRIGISVSWAWHGLLGALFLFLFHLHKGDCVKKSS
jgi:hypothetical protein